jgi:hypothetical protein
MKRGGAVEYAVKVTTIKYYGSGVAVDEATADKRIQNLLRRYGGSAEMTHNRSLSTIGSPPAPPDPGHWFARSDKESFVIWCRPNAYCQGYLDLKDRYLHIHFLLSRHAVPEHKSIISGVRVLLDRWTLPS